MTFFFNYGYMGGGDQWGASESKDISRRLVPSGCYKQQRLWQISEPPDIACTNRLTLLANGHTGHFLAVGLL